MSSHCNNRQPAPANHLSLSSTSGTPAAGPYHSHRLPWCSWPISQCVDRASRLQGNSPMHILFCLAFHVNLHIEVGCVQGAMPETQQNSEHYEISKYSLSNGKVPVKYTHNLTMHRWLPDSGIAVNRRERSGQWHGRTSRLPQHLGQTSSPGTLTLQHMAACMDHRTSPCQRCHLHRAIMLITAWSLVVGHGS